MTESAYWESHYQKGENPWDKGEASPGLLDFLQSHPDLMKGSVCIPGCGMGHDARCSAEASAKWQNKVTIVVAEEAIRRALTLPVGKRVYQ